MAFSFTLTEWVILGLVLLFGWILGLLSSGGGKKWRARYDEEYAGRADDRVTHAEALKAEQLRYEALETRHRELERTRTAPVAAPVTGAAIASSAAAASTHHTTTGDDLSLVRGVGPDGRTRLRDEGIHSYQDLETIDDARAEEIERRHGLAQGTIAREDWRGQARLLREGEHDEHRRRFS